VHCNLPSSLFSSVPLSLANFLTFKYFSLNSTHKTLSCHYVDVLLSFRSQPRWIRMTLKTNWIKGRHPDQASRASSAYRALGLLQPSSMISLVRGLRAYGCSRWSKACRAVLHSRHLPSSLLTHQITLHYLTPRVLSSQLTRPSPMRRLYASAPAIYRIEQDV
jgi:hypothetical protein